MKGSPKKDRAKYSRTNPPANEEAARLRMDQLDHIVGKIDAELDHTRPDEFETDGDYLGWKRSALSAISHYRRERDFLEEWLKPPSTVKISPGDAAMLQRLRDRVAELCESLEADYTPTYSSSNQPASLPEARERMLVLAAMNRRLMESFAETASLWRSNVLNKRWLVSVRAPLQRIASVLQAEQAAIKAYIRTKSVELNAVPSLNNWHATCVEALKRAAARGFQLTELEQEVLRNMEAYINREREELAASKS